MPSSVSSTIRIKGKALKGGFSDEVRAMVIS